MPTYTLEQVQTLLEAQRLRMVDQFNQQMSNALAPPTGEQIAQDLQKKQWTSDAKFKICSWYLSFFKN